MKLLNYAEKMPGSYEFAATGDQHGGNMDIMWKAFPSFRRWVVASKNRYWGSGGDQIEAIAVDDKRFQIDNHVGNRNSPDHPVENIGRFTRVKNQCDFFVQQMDAIADKGLYMLDGNHELKHRKITFFAQEMAEALGIDYGTYTVKADFGAFKLYDWHGSGGCNSKAGDQMQRYNNECIWVKRRLRDLAADCDVMIMHHIHKIRIHPPTLPLMLMDDGVKIIQDYPAPVRIPLDNGRYYIQESQRWYASSGSMLRSQAIGHSGYAEIAGYSPNELGFVVVKVKNDKLVSVTAKHY